MTTFKITRNSIEMGLYEAESAARAVWDHVRHTGFESISHAARVEALTVDAFLEQFDATEMLRYVTVNARGLANLSAYITRMSGDNLHSDAIARDLIAKWDADETACAIEIPARHTRDGNPTTYAFSDDEFDHHVTEA